VYNTPEPTRGDKLNKLKVHKSPGPDSLHPRVLSELRYQLNTPLRLIYETSYNTGCIPRDWKFANTVPIYKKGSKAECNNYRPVSLTNVVCKVMESVIRDHIMKFFSRQRFFQQYAVWVSKKVDQLFYSC